MKFQVHPVHMMVIHFPAALLPMDFVFLVAAKYFENVRLAEVAYYCLMSGVITGWIAMVLGFYDLFKYLPHAGGSALKQGFAHGSVQSIGIIGFTILLSLEYKDQSYIYNTPVWLWITKGILIGVMLAGNYLGGELVFNYVSKQIRSSGPQ